MPNHCDQLLSRGLLGARHEPERQVDRRAARGDSGQVGIPPELWQMLGRISGHPQRLSVHAGGEVCFQHRDEGQVFLRIVETALHETETALMGPS